MSEDASIVDTAEQAARLARPRVLEHDERALFGGAGTEVAFLAGDVVFRRGEHGRSMFIVAAGEVRLCFGDDFADKLLEPGQYFGELAVFLGDHYRTATVIAETDCRLREIDAAAFDALLAREPVRVAQFMRASFSYLVAGENQLLHGLRRRNEDLMRALDALRQTRSELTLAQQMVRSDELTGLANRRGLYAFLDEIADQQLPDLRRALLLIDIDNFKAINDRRGHLAGDSALRAVAEAVRAQAGPFDLPCRLGGDEFALVLAVADEGDLANRAIGLCAAVRNLRLPALGDMRLTVSVGAVFCRNDTGWSGWYSEADAVLLRAKGMRAPGGGWRLG
ncbi:sensor domain-containing diguanylate cyclase [Coralloluteibacterium thermophilus]|uniref:diguanylate cyclase n=1 Tax=Coralloluteibacterium thermophilum TaxID=2707049 RepID=A0ABV9NI69_9GAMM